MKDNIDSKCIANRKIIIELRFDPILSILDQRGLICEKIKNTGVFPGNEWEIGQADITYRDTKDKNDANEIFTVTINRLSYISWHIDSVESYFTKFKKLYDAVIPLLQGINVSRIGSRIIGTYKVKSTSYNTILDNFLKSFPSAFLVEEYSARDFLFHLDYNHGMYQIGPIKEDDDYYAREFRAINCIKHVGIAIDTDNYITNDNKTINGIELIKDIFKLSLSVEKDLYTHLKDL